MRIACVVPWDLITVYFARFANRQALWQLWLCAADRCGQLHMRVLLLHLCQTGNMSPHYIIGWHLLVYGSSLSTAEACRVEEVHGACRSCLDTQMQKTDRRVQRCWYHVCRLFRQA